MTFPATKEGQNTLPTINIGANETFCPICNQDVSWITVTTDGDLPIKICPNDNTHRFNVSHFIIN